MPLHWLRKGSSPYSRSSHSTWQRLYAVTTRRAPSRQAVTNPNRAITFSEVVPSTSSVSTIITSAGKPFIMSESVSALQTRGFYMMPSDSVIVAPKEWWLPYTDPTYMCSSYDNMHASWSTTHETNWDVVKHTPYCGGQYIWTGFDYIGEPTPYGFPARSSYFGIIDLAGFPKDIYYMYQSEWTSKPVLHLFPHWNWIPGDEIDMWCYYNNAERQGGL